MLVWYDVSMMYDVWYCMMLLYVSMVNVLYVIVGYDMVYYTCMHDLVL